MVPRSFAYLALKAPWPARQPGHWLDGKGRMVPGGLGRCVTIERPHHRRLGSCGEAGGLVGPSGCEQESAEAEDQLTAR
jgi:hypothetical protein